MKKSIYLILFLSLFASLLLALIVGIEESLKDVWGTIRIISPILLVLSFPIDFLFKTGYFFEKIKISSVQLYFQDRDYPTNNSLSFQNDTLLMKCNSIFSFHFPNNRIFQTKNNNCRVEICLDYRSKLYSNGT